MSVFQDTPIPKDTESLRVALRAIEAQRQAQGLPSEAWSLAELELTEADWLWLGAFASAVPPSLVTDLLGRRDRVGEAGTGLGALLFLLCAETARRFATSDDLWGPVSREIERQSRRLAGVIFTGSQPNDFLKCGIEAAARSLRLRHFLDDREAGQAKHWWFHTVKAQYGLSREAARDRLADYLVAPGLCESLGALLWGRGADQPRSESFREYWNTLLQFRRGHLTEPDALRRLARSPWVCGDGAALIKAAKKAATVPGVEETDLEPTPLAQGVRLLWDGMGEPQLEIHLEKVALDAVPEVWCAVRVNGMAIGSLNRQKNGSMALDAYAVTPGETPYAFRIPWDGAADVALTLTGEDGVEAGAELVTVFEQASEVTAFRVDGKRYTGTGERQGVAPDRPCLLLVAPGLNLHAQYAETADRFSAPVHYPLASGAILYRIPPGWRMVRVQDGDETLWLAGGGGTPLPHPIPPEWVRAVTCKWKWQAESQTLGVRVSNLPPGAEVTAVRVPGVGPLEPQASGQWGAVLPPNLPEICPVSVTVERDGIAGRERVRLHLRELVRPSGAYLRSERTEGQWRYGDPHSALDTSELAHAHLRVYRARDWDGEAMGEPGKDEFAYVFEGDRCLGRVSLRRSARLPHGAPILGWGRDLSIHPARFNAIGLPVPVAQSLAHTDTLADWQREGVELILRFRGPRELDTNTRIHLWDSCGERYDLTDEEIRPEAMDCWRIACPQGCEPLAVAVAQSGIRAGAAWSSEAAQRLAGWPKTPEIAAVLRWLRQPLLAEGFRPSVQSWLRGAHPTVIAAWVRGDGLPVGFRYSDRDGWKAVLPALLELWEAPEPETGKWAKRLLAQLTPLEGVGPDAKSAVRLGTSMALLADIAPLIAARAARAFFERYLPSQGNVSAAAVQRCYQDTRAEAEHRLRRILPPDTNGTRNDYLDAAAYDLGVDVRFIRRLASLPNPVLARPTDTQNWRIACQDSAAFRAAAFLWLARWTENDSGARA